MNILFINSSSKCDIFFSAQFNNNNNNNKNCPTQGFNPTRPNPCGLGWVEFFLTHHDGLSQNPLNPTHVHPYAQVHKAYPRELY